MATPRKMTQAEYDLILASKAHIPFDSETEVEYTDDPVDDDVYQDEYEDFI